MTESYTLKDGTVAKIITAKFSSKCAACGSAVAAGQQIKWAAGRRDVEHKNCSTQATRGANKVAEEQAARSAARSAADALWQAKRETPTEKQLAFANEIAGALGLVVTVGTRQEMSAFIDSHLPRYREAQARNDHQAREEARAAEATAGIVRINPHWGRYMRDGHLTVKDGDTIRYDGSHQTPAGLYTITRIDRQHAGDNASSVGGDYDSPWVYTLICRLATPEEAAAIEAREAVAAERKAAAIEFRAIDAQFRGVEPQRQDAIAGWQDAEVVWDTATTTGRTSDPSYRSGGGRLYRVIDYRYADVMTNTGGSQSVAGVPDPDGAIARRLSEIKAVMTRAR